MILWWTQFSEHLRIFGWFRAFNGIQWHSMPDGVWNQELRTIRGNFMILKSFASEKNPRVPFDPKISPELGVIEIRINFQIRIIEPSLKLTFSPLKIDRPLEVWRFWTWKPIICFWAFAVSFRECTWLVAQSWRPNYLQWFIPSLSLRQSSSSDMMW